MGFLAGMALLATAASGVNVLRGPASTEWDLVLVTGGSGPYWQRVSEGAAAAARECGARLRVETLEASDVAQAQAALVERLATERHDGVAFCPLASEVKSSSFAPLSRSSKLLTYPRDISREEVICRVLQSEYSSGRKAANAAVELMRKGGTVVALTSPGEAQ
jgi:ABC-type sugar transport system substrate-binding protein